MLIGYFLLVFLIMLQGLPYLLCKKSSFAKLFLGFSFLELWLLATFRAPTFVTDDMGYLIIFRGDAPCYFESGFCQLNNLIKLLGIDSYIYFGVLACCVFIPIWIFIKRYSSNILISILAYICLMYAFNSVNGIRQFIALAIIFIFFPYVQKRQFIKFFIVIMFACLFHKSAIICLSFYWLYIIEVNFKNIFLIITSSFIFCLFFEQFSSLYVSFGGNYANYISGEVEQGRLSVIIRFIVNLSIAVCCLIAYKKDKNISDTKRHIPFNFLTICACISAAGALIALKAYSAERIVYYFYLFNIITIPNMLQQIHNKPLKGLVSLLVLLCLISYGAVILWYWQNQGIIYEFMWR